MRNLYSNTMPPAAMRDLFEVSPEHDHLGNAEPRPAVFPKGMAPVVRIGQGGERELVEMRWGFLTPSVSNRAGKPMKPHAWNNARDDKLVRNGLWRSSIVERRCLIPVTAFNETKGERPATDYWFGLVAEDPDARPPFAVAGLWRLEREELRSRDEDGLTHTMVTTEANDLIRPIHKHKRMPVILDPESYETWLQGPVDEALALLRPYPSDRMRIVRQGIGEKSDPARV